MAGSAQAKFPQCLGVWDTPAVTVWAAQGWVRWKTPVQLGLLLSAL